MPTKPGSRLSLPLVALLSGLAAMTGGTLLADPCVQAKEQSLVPVVYFYSPTCRDCQKARESIDAAQRKYAGKIRLECHSVASADGLELMFAYEEKYGADESAPPKVFVGKEHLGGGAAIIAQLNGLIEKELAAQQSQAPTPTTKPAPAAEPAALAPPAPTTKPAPVIETAMIYNDPSLPPKPQNASYTMGPPLGPPDMSGSDSAPPTPLASAIMRSPANSQDPAPGVPGVPGARLDRRFQSFQVGAIMLAGLVDGVNPCAFTTVVFLLSAIAYLGKTKREIAIVGITFTVAVFITYLLLGLGFMLAIKTFAMQAGISRMVTYIVAGLVFVLAGWSLFDGVRITRTGKVPKGSLGLPEFLKAVIRRVIKAGLKTRNLVIGSLVVGFVVALVGSFCTGEVYVPTIMIMLRSPGHSYLALVYLLIFNVMFVVPLSIVMVGAYFGVRSERVGTLLRGHLAALKFVLAGLFGGLGLILLLFIAG